MTREDLIGKIVGIAGDYRKGEIAKFDAKHVEKWIEQFPLNEQYKDMVLLETGHLLEKFYLSRDAAKEKLTLMLKTMKEERAGGCSIFDVNFLRTQAEGKSQSEMLILADEILKEARGKGVDECGGSNVYLYLDDCLYSGNMFKYDILNSDQLDEAPKGSTLISYHFSIYNGGLKYVRQYIEKIMHQKGGEYKPFRYDIYNNDRFNGKELDILWPTYMEGNKYVDEFVRHSNEKCINRGWSLRPLFRTSQPVSSSMFTSAKNRFFVEQIFLEIGSKLFCAAKNPAPSMRPMGFEVIGTIGFGTPIVTWRNIANNCPLALWYGNPAYGSDHPLGMWYPLFPRKV